MPYTKAEFDLDKQNKFKLALAVVSGTSSLNIDIVSTIEGNRRAANLAVETKVRHVCKRASLTRASVMDGEGVLWQTCQNHVSSRTILAFGLSLCTSITFLHTFDV